MNIVSVAELALVFVVVPATGGFLAFLVRYIVPTGYEIYVEGVIGLYLFYFGGSFLYTVFVSELRETPVLGVPLGNSPVFALILAAFGVGMAAGLGTHRVYESLDTKD